MQRARAGRQARHAAKLWRYAALNRILMKNLFNQK
jgi:hypothetical protein